MRRKKAFTLVELLVVVGIIGMLAAMLIPTIQVALRIAEMGVCAGNLKGVGTAVQIYRSQNDQRWPWIPNVRSDWSKGATGTNRDVDLPLADEDPGERSLTAVMFLLVRDGQSPGLFVCPSDTRAESDRNVRWDHDGDRATRNVYYWDFASARNVSYSWQAPVRKGDTYVNGMTDDDAAAVILADRSPAWPDGDWTPDALDARTTTDVLRDNISPHHRGIGRLNVLRTDMAVMKVRRPDVGVDRDNIYTASGQKAVGARDGTSLNLADHLTPTDTFVIGPVGSGGADPNS